MNFFFFSLIKINFLLVTIVLMSYKYVYLFIFWQINFVTSINVHISNYRAFFIDATIFVSRITFRIFFHSNANNNLV